MDRYTLILVSDERSPMKRFHFPKSIVKRAASVAAVIVLVMGLFSWDYWRLRAENAELASLRLESTEQREQITTFKGSLREMQAQLARVQELERKVRIIANLPGAAAVGGDQVTELAPQPTHPGVGLQPPAGVPIDMNASPLGLDGQGGDNLEIPLTLVDPSEVDGVTTAGAREVATLALRAEGLTRVASGRGDTLDDLLIELESKRDRLASLPSVWPTRGWLTSRFGPRISPFTNKRHQHSGIDVAARSGTPIIAPARGTVAFTGRKGPLGNALIIDHGYGVRTFYGHTDKIHVTKGAKVERGQRVADVGNTGRSTGPHLHYTVEVHGKSRDPLDYIFD